MAPKYVIINGCAIIFSGAIQHKDMVGFNQKATGAGFVNIYYDESKDMIVVKAYGRSISLGIESHDEDTDILTHQITNNY